MNNNTGRRSLRERLAWRWNEAGLASAASAGRSELDKRGMNAVIFDSPRAGVSVFIARGERAAQLREAWVSLFGGEDDAAVPLAPPEPPGSELDSLRARLGETEDALRQARAFVRNCGPLMGNRQELDDILTAAIEEES